MSVTLGDASVRKINAALRAKLAKPITFSVTDQPLEDAVAAFARAAEVNVWVNWTALTTAGIDKNTKVTVNLRYEAPGDAVLSLLLSEAGGATNPLSYGFDRGALLISTRDELNSERYRVVRIYDVRDLIGAGPELGPQLTRADTVRAVCVAIMATVAPTSWVDNGGTIGSVMEYGGRLLINQTEANHVEVENVLAALRWGLAQPMPAAKAPVESKEEARAKLRLGETITMFYEDRRLDNVLSDLTEKIRLDVIVDWAALRGAGFDPDQKVSFKIRQGEPAEAAITLLLSNIKSPKADAEGLGWQVRKGAIVVSTRSRSTEVRVYDIEDVITARRRADENLGPVVATLEHAIEAGVDPTSWVENGGTVGTMLELQGRLVIRQTRENLEAVEHLLAELRRPGQLPGTGGGGGG